MSTLIVKEIEVNVVKIPDYTEELNKIEVAKSAVKEALESCEIKAYQMGEDIVEQIGIYVSNLMYPILNKHTYGDLKGYFMASGYHKHFFVDLGARGNNPFLILRSCGSYDDCRLLMEFYNDGDYEVVRNNMDAELLAALVTEWPDIKSRLLTENERFINNQKSAMEKASKDMIDAVQIINSFEL